MTRRSSWLLVLITLAAFAWRVQGLAWQSLWRDEVDAIYFATRDLSQTLRMFVDAGQNGPLYFVALRPWFGLVGTSEFALRYPSALAGTLGVVLTWQVGRRLIPLHLPSANAAAPRRGIMGQDAAALLAALFFAANPYQLWYSQEGKMYTVISVVALLATWWWLQGIERGGWRPWLAYWLTLTLGMYTHLLIILVFPLHLIWFVLAWPASRQHWRGYGLALAGLTLPYVPMVWWQWRLLTADVQLTGFSFTPIDEMARVLIFNHSRGFMPPADLGWIAPIFFLAAAGLLIGAGEIASRTHPDGVALAPWRRYALVAAWLIVPVLGIYALSLRQPIFTDRYVIWIAPAAMMVLALGVVVVQRHGWMLGRVLAAALVIYVVGFWLYVGWQQKAQPTKYDLRGGVSYIAARRDAVALLILQIPHMEYAYRYYTSDFGPRPFEGSDARIHPWIGGLWTNHGWPDDPARAEVDRQMQAQTAGYSDIWVLRSEVEMWDQRHLMDAWLDQHATLVEQADFHGVQVRRYQLAP